MCGIYGEISNNHEVNSDTILENLQLLDHRGPDAQGIWVDDFNRVGLSFKRLSILDLSSAGNQPMFSEDENFVIIFNGEIYNHDELRGKLKLAGYKFNSNSDTEVLLNSYIHWPADFLSRLEGMFSFAIFSKKENIIRIARDLAGQKPLYYNFTDSVFKFASELKPILKNNSEHELSDHSIVNYFKYGFSHKDQSLIKGYKKLLPGEWLEFDVNKWKINVDTCFCLPAIIKPDKRKKKFLNINKLSTKLIELLNTSIESQLKADVDVGVMLSGGLDSGIVATLASNFKSSLKTFSATFLDDHSVDESKYSRALANHINSDHHEFVIRDIKPCLLEEIIYYYDDPLGSPSFVPTYLLSKEIKKFCKVVMGGDGADELFGGYYPYSRIDRFNLSKNKFFKHFYIEPKNFINKIEGSNLKGRGLLMNMLKDITSINHSMEALFSNTERQKLLGNNFSQETQKFNGSFSNDYLNNILIADFSYYLPEEVLKKVDRSSMANSLEVRSPFLDTRIINFAFNELPSKYKVHGGKRKIILQKIASNLFPKNYNFNRKQGFSFPINKYFLNKKWQKFFKSKVNSSNSLINKDYAMLILNKHQKNKNEGIKLFRILIFVLWFEKFVHNASDNDYLIKA